MTISIELPPSAEAQLRAHAAATGKSISALVVEAVQARLALARLPLKELLRPLHEDFRQSGMSGDDLDRLLEDSLKQARADRQSAAGSSE